MWLSPVYPSVPLLNIALFRYLFNHPLFIEPLVVHPITGQHVPVANYRQKDGFSSLPGLLCSIYPASGGAVTAESAPTATNVTAILNNRYNLSESGHQEVLYHFICKFTYNLEVAFDDLTKANYEPLIRVPTEAIVYKDQIDFALEHNRTNVNLYLDIPSFIIGSYMELARLAFQDQEYRINKFDFPGIHTIEVLHYNCPTQIWEQGTNIIANFGYLYLRLTGHLSRGWRDHLRFPLQEIKVKHEDDK